MKGLKSQENDKFLKFWALVENFAEKQGCIFYAECGEGHMLETDVMECEDMRGWLIPQKQASEFEKEWRINRVSDKWIDNICWAEWRVKGGKVLVEFNTY